MALDVMRVVYETGLEVPGDTNIVGFDDIPKAS
jgi:DNA-binding LacI/PurR family transcriptional regulator